MYAELWLCARVDVPYGVAFLSRTTGFPLDCPYSYRTWFSPIAHAPRHITLTTPRNPAIDVSDLQEQQ